MPLRQTIPILIYFLLVSCSDPQIREAGSKRAGLPDQESWNVTITLTDEGLRRAVVKSGHLEKYNQRRFILLDQNVVVDFFDSEERHTSNLVSEIAQIDEKTNFMTAIDNVVVVSDSGVTLFTDTLSWDNRKELVFTDDSVMVHTEENDTLYGVGFESDVSLQYWKILQPSGVTGWDDDK